MALPRGALTGNQRPWRTCVVVKILNLCTVPLLSLGKYAYPKWRACCIFTSWALLCKPRADQELELDQQHLCWAPGALVSRVGRKSFVCLLFCTDGFCSTCPSCDWLLVLNLLCFRLFRSVTLSPDRWQAIVGGELLKKGKEKNP